MCVCVCVCVCMCVFGNAEAQARLLSVYKFWGKKGANIWERLFKLISANFPTTKTYHTFTKIPTANALLILFCNDLCERLFPFYQYYFWQCPLLEEDPLQGLATCFFSGSPCYFCGPPSLLLNRYRDLLPRG